VKKSRGISRVLVALLVLTPLAVTATASSEALTIIPVKTPDRGSAGGASADGAWFGWRHTTQGGTSSYVVQRGDRSRIRVNPKGTTAEAGGIYRRTLVYEQWTNEESSDLYRFALRSGRRTKLPDQVNTRRGRETDPTLSGQYLLFNRGFRKNSRYFERVMLYDRRTQTPQVLAKTKDWVSSSIDHSLLAGQVNGPWTVWTYGNFYEDSGTYKIFLYDIRRDITKRVVPPIDDFYQSPDPAVSSDGTVYFVRNGEIVRKPLGAPAEVLYAVPARWTAGELYVDDRPEARHVYFTLYGTRGIYKVIDPLP
jgi:hypothetical protein